MLFSARKKPTTASAPCRATDGGQPVNGLGSKHTTSARMAGLTLGQWEELALALTVTLCASALPRWRVVRHLWSEGVWGLDLIPWYWFSKGVLLFLALLLVLPTLKRSGICIGEIRRYRLRVLLITLLVVSCVAAVYSRLPTQPFSGGSAGTWIISPVAQDLIFWGYLFGRLRLVFPGYVHSRLPVETALCITAFFFALWHTPNFIALPAGFVAFQLFYTSVGGIVGGLTRQWTGSVLPVVFIHSATNFIAWGTL